MAALADRFFSRNQRGVFVLFREAMNFTKTTLAVAMGIILAPFLLMLFSCGGCLTLLGIGATGTALAPDNRQASRSNDATSQNSTGVATNGESGISKSTAAEELTSARAREIYEADQARFANEERAREEAAAQRKKHEEAEADLKAWKEQHPEPPSPQLDERTWNSVVGDYSVDGVLVDADDEIATIRRSDDGREIEVPIEKLAAKSRVYVQLNAQSFEAYREWQAALKEQEAVFAAIEEPEVPSEPRPAMTIAEANAQAEQEAEMEEAAREAEERNRPQMTMANFNRCRPGMTYDQVVSIVGPPNEVLSENQIANIHTVMYSWKAGIVANANMTFQNGKLVSKAQFGL
jgi:hypothetical protein